MLSARERVALAGLVFLLVVTSAWWAFALWPLPTEAPAWLIAGRQVCFGVAPDGLPDAAGWIALAGQPAFMIGLLMLLWGDAVRSGIGTLRCSSLGGVVVNLTIVFIVAGLGAAGLRVATAGATSLVDAPDIPPSTYPRLDRDAPPVDLVDQHGQHFTLDRLAGRPAIVTFAFAHCATICPVIVQDALRAQERLAELDPVVVVVTLDPWRDPPSRLPHIARIWGLGDNAVVLSGTVPEVEAALDAWNVARWRDERTGDVTHPRLIYLVDGNGRIAYALNGGPDAIVDLAGRL